MGADFQWWITVDSIAQSKITKAYKEEAERDGYENGHSYSGGFAMAPGLTFTGKEFETEEAAIEYIETTAQKWENALAVTVKPKEKGKKPYTVIGGIFSY